MFVQLDAAIVGMMTNVIIVITVNMIINIATDLFRPNTPNMFGGPSCSRPLQEYQERDNSESPHMFLFLLLHFVTEPGIIMSYRWRFF